MKIVLAMLIIEALVAGVAAAPPENIITAPSQEFRDFHGENGKTVRARILAYNPSSNKVTIRKENTHMYKIPLNQFSEADQAYVREWYLLDGFFSQSRFHLSAKKIRARTEQADPWLLINDDDDRRVWKDTESIAYEIRLDNRNRHDLNGLSLDYCIYYGDEELNYRGPVMDERMKFGTKKIGTIAQGKRVLFKTESVAFPKEKRSPEYYKEHRAPVSGIRGVWVRVYLPLAGGRIAMREISDPESLMHQRKWITPK